MNEEEFRSIIKKKNLLIIVILIAFVLVVLGSMKAIDEQQKLVEQYEELIKFQIEHWLFLKRKCNLTDYTFQDSLDEFIMYKAEELIIKNEEKS